MNAITPLGKRIRPRNAASLLRRIMSAIGGGCGIIRRNRETATLGSPPRSFPQSAETDASPAIVVPFHRPASGAGGTMTRDQRIALLLDTVLNGTTHPQRMLDRLVVRGMELGLEWHEIVGAVDEAEHRTGLRLHPMDGHPGRR